MNVWLLVGHDDVLYDVLGVFSTEAAAREAAELEFTTEYEEYDILEMEVQN